MEAGQVIVHLGAYPVDRGLDLALALLAAVCALATPFVLDWLRS